MCFGCCDTAECGRCFADIFYILEKLSSCCAFTAVVSCIMITLTFVLVIGIGLGYNYCVVEKKIESSPGLSTPGSLRSGEDTTEPSYRRTQSKVHRKTVPMPSIKPTMVIPLHEEVDLKSLLSKLRGQNQNVTLQLVT